MIEIKIMPAVHGQSGWYRSIGHAEGLTQVCTAVTSIEECLAANLETSWGLRVTRKAVKGRYELNWNKSDRKGWGLDRANRAAGFAYNGLKALAKQYPEHVTVEWMKPVIERRDKQ